jgi:glutamate dehydrogenase/leucine dehydrogenase
VIQGAGNAGLTAAKLLQPLGAKIIGISDSK